MKLLKIAVFGTGYWSQFQIAAWQAIGCKVIAVWNRTKSKAVETSEHFSIPSVYDTPEDVFKNADFDIADIITDPVFHEELVLMAAKYKKAVICQKPMAPTQQACVRMVKACADAGVWYAVHENFRFQPPIRKVKDLLETGVIGRCVRAHIQLRSPDREIISRQPALAVMDHMVMRDMGPHIFDVIRCLFGDIESVYSNALSTYPDINTDDTALSILQMKNGMLVSCDLVHEFPYKIFAEGDKGTLMLDRDNLIFIKTGSGTETVDPRVWEHLSYIPDDDWELHGGHVFTAIPECLKMLRNSFIKSVPAETSGEDNLKTMKAVFASILSQDENRPVSL